MKQIDHIARLNLAIALLSDFRNATLEVFPAAAEIRLNDLHTGLFAMEKKLRDARRVLEASLPPIVSADATTIVGGNG